MTNILFDYDGTIHETMVIYEPAFRKALAYMEKEGLVEPREYTKETVAEWLGITAGEMWESFAPYLSNTQKRMGGKMIGDEMLRLINNKKARLYDGAERTLEILQSRGYRLILLSNCDREYMAAHKRAFGLERLFDGIYCAEDFSYLPKYEIFKKIRPLYDGDFFVVGDRSKDMDIAEKNNIPSVGCLYGYGTAAELRNADMKINRITELIDIF